MLIWAVPVLVIDPPAGGASPRSINVAQPRYRGQGGHPPLVDRALWQALAACGDEPGGARGVLRAGQLVAVDVDDPGVVCDVDTPADLEAIA